MIDSGEVQEDGWIVLGTICSALIVVSYFDMLNLFADFFEKKNKKKKLSVLQNWVTLVSVFQWFANDHVSFFFGPGWLELNLGRVNNVYNYTSLYILENYLGGKGKALL